MQSRPVLSLTNPAQVMDATIGAMTIGLVPIMSRVHAGHLPLINRACMENDETVVVLFDPAGEPIPIDKDDIAEIRRAGGRIIYQPAADAIFPPGFGTVVRTPGLAQRYEGAANDGQMDRVVAFVVILINQLQPTRTYLGEKHLQQLRIIQRVHADLALSGQIVPCVTVRDPDGLPLSSYNSTLSADERAAAIAIPQSLVAMQYAVTHGELDAEALLRIGSHVLQKQPMMQVEYLAIVDPATFTAVTNVSSGDYAIVAATIGDTRMLDCIHLEPGGTGQTDS